VQKLKQEVKPESTRPKRTRTAAGKDKTPRWLNLFPGPVSELPPSHLLWKVSHHSFRILDEVLAPLALRARPFAFMLVIRSNGSISQQELASVSGVDPSTVVAIIDAMERADLAERRRNPDDRRAYRLHLTRNGEKLLAAAEERLANYEERLLAPLTATERKTLVRLLGKVLDAS